MSEQREKLNFSFDGKETFVGTSSSKFMTTNELAHLISSKFKPFSADFIGVRFDIGKGKSFMGIPCNLVLADKSKDPDKFKCVVPYATSAKHTDFISRYNAINSDHDSLELTDDAKDMFEKFVPNGSFYSNAAIRIRNKNNEEQINWKNAIKEKVYNTNAFGFGPQNMIVQLEVQFDVIRFFKELYGSTDSKGNNVKYVVSNAAPMYPNGTNGMFTSSSAYMLQITQINEEYVKKLVAECYPNINATDVIC